MDKSEDKLKEAIVLAGGFGTRLQSVVKDVPKPMASVAGKPFLHYVVQQLIAQGINRIIFSVGYLSESIIDYFEENKYEAEILFQIEKDQLGTGGAIKFSLEKSETENVLVLNGDTFFDIDFQLLFKFHQEKNAKATLALRAVDNVSRYGRVVIDETDTVDSFNEKSKEDAGKGLINGGTYIINKDFYSQIKATKFSIEKDFFEKFVSDSIFFGQKFDGYFIDIGIPEDYALANEDFKTQ
jgi:D-glycero-alpha-D-manno-heptose 1-phosphate guanylyltransferase